MDVEITNFHRTLSSAIASFRRAGFRLVDIVEPTMSERQHRNFPGMEDERRVPNFIIYVVERP
jgi:hypothetical protein